jgi:hypothetical protein
MMESVTKISEIVQFLSTNWEVIVSGLLMVVGGFAVFARFTPNKSDDAIMQKIYDFINGMAQNRGKSSNDPKA